MRRRVLVAVFIAASLAATACSSSEGDGADVAGVPDTGAADATSDARQGDAGLDSGADAPRPDTSDDAGPGDVVEDGGEAGGDADAGADAETDTSDGSGADVEPGGRVELRSRGCAAGGPVEGGGVRGSMCLAPRSVANPISTNGVTNWRPGRLGRVR